MFPILIDLGRVNLPFFGETHLFLPTYGVLFATGVILAWRWFARRAATLGIEDELVFSLVFYGLLAGLFGAKLGLVIVDWQHYLDDPSALFGVLRAAGILVVGVICAAVVFWLYSRHHELPALALGDAAAAPLALAQSVGRLGCFSAGCCWGAHAEANSAFAITFGDEQAHELTGVPLGIPLLPIQLVQMAHDLVLALVLTWMWRRRPRPAGTVFWFYVLVYSLGRGIIEFWRGDDRGLYFGGHVSTTQLLAMGGIALAVTMLLRGRMQLRSGRLRTERA